MRDKGAALTFIKKAVTRYGSPEVIIINRLRGYCAAMTELGTRGRRGVGRCANNRAENSHLPFSRRKRAMLRFRQMRTMRKFASVTQSSTTA